MDAAQALADLTEISSQIETAVVFRREGGLAGSTLADGNRAERLAGAAQELLDAAESVRAGDAPLTQLEVATQDGSVFVVRDGDTYIAATTGTEPTVGLVFYDLKSCLRDLEEPPAPKKKRSAPKRKPASTRKQSDAKS
jgi:predicted regulator of Ras-like GTPase activity (Roadblock/LC7/MglB family)